MTDITVPMLNSNDEEYILTEWLAADGAVVQEGEPIAIIETSKAASELTSLQSGTLRRLVPEMTACRQGDVVAVISGGIHPAADAADMAQDPGKAIDDEPADLAVSVTDAARDLMREHGITVQDVAKPGTRLIRLADVKSAVRQRSEQREAPRSDRVESRTQQGNELSRQQQAIARVVSQSHATIPSAFLAFKVSVPWVSRSGPGLPIRVADDIPQRVVSSVASAAKSFPLMFAHVSDDLRLTPANSIDVGVTFDAGHGLTIPVIRHADEKNITELSASLLALRVRARRGKLSDKDLRDPAIVVALQQEPGVLISMPIIYPGTVCTVSVGAMDWEVVLGDSGPYEQAWFTLGISYDHRVVNGRDAAAFLTEVSTFLKRQADEPETPKADR